MEQSIVTNDKSLGAGQPQEERTGRLGLSQEQMADFIKSLPDELQQKIASLDKKMGEIKTAKLEDFESTSKPTEGQGDFALNESPKPESAAILDMISEIKPSGNLGPEVEQRLSDMRIEYIRQLTEAVNAAERRYVGAKILELTTRRNQLSRQQEKASRRPLAWLISPKKLGILKQELARIDIKLEQLRAEVGASTEQVPEFGAAPQAEQGKPEQPPQAA